MNCTSIARPSYSHGTVRAVVCVAVIACLAAHALAADAQPSNPPNILFCISDDQSWLHAGAYGDRVVKTPAIDRVAREGVLFTNAFCVTPSCTASRGAILTGQHCWRLGAGANLHSSLPAGLQTLPELLERAGYAVGCTRKGWGPGDWHAGGRTRNPAGDEYKSFEDFLTAKKSGQPFWFWFGSNEPHRPFEYGAGQRAGKSAAAVDVPPIFPDVAEVRSDLLDYYHEIEQFDRDLGHLLDVLEQRCELDDTIVLVTSDNGMAFPRSKTSLYDSGTHLPLAVRWPREVPAGRAIADFVSFVDIAPTLLEAAGQSVPAEMTGRSFLSALTSKAAGQVDAARDHVLLGRERHVAYRPGGVGYPARAIRTQRYLYIRNLEPDRWPAGDPPHYVDIDQSPTKYWMLLHQDEPAVRRLFALATAKRPAEELYDLTSDPWQMTNVAEQGEYASAKQELAAQLNAELVRTGDPRALGQPVTWDSDPYYGRDKDAWLDAQQEEFDAFSKRQDEMAAARPPKTEDAHDLDRAAPNVLFIAVDDLRPDLGCYGVSSVLSPNIDRLAARGLVFRHAYVQQAVCGPSRASFLSGLRPDSTAITDNAQRLDAECPDAVTLPAWFKQNGYHTVSLGKISHWPGDNAKAWSERDWRPFNMSPSSREYRDEAAWALMRRLHAQQRGNRDKVPALDTMKGPAYEALDLPDDVYPDGLTADMAVHTLARLKDMGEPFFLAVGFVKPHLPFACPKAYWDMYDPTSIHLAANDAPPTGMPDMAFVDSDELRAYYGIPPAGTPVDDALARRLIHGYRACISYMDAQVGRVLDELDRLDLADDTIVVLLGDHGWHLGEQGIWAKQTNFERGTRAPLIVRTPDARAAGRETDALVEMVDIYPSLCELARVPAHERLEGQSFVPLLDSPDRAWKQAAFSQYPRGKPQRYLGRSMRTERYRFTRWVDLAADERVVGLELYDHQTDPGETVNLAANAESADVVAALGAQLDAGWRAARASNETTADQYENEAGFEPLFNGRDLAGWDGMPGAWSVRDGAITSGGTEKNWLIWRGGEVEDFELRLRFRYSQGNSGVQVRSENLGNWQVRGYQVEVGEKTAMGLWHQSLWTDPDRKYLATAGQRVHIAADGTKTVEQFGDAATVQAAFKENDWNDLVVVGRGRRLVQKINGVVFSELVDEETPISRTKGVIALQDHGHNCVAEFKDIRLKHLESN